MSLDTREEAFNEYQCVLKQLDTFEKVTYDDWLHKVGYLLSF